MPRLHLVVISIVAAGCARGPAVDSGSSTAAADRPAAAVGSTRGTYVLLRGADTIAIERFTRSEERLTVEFSAGGTVQLGYDAALAADAPVSRLELTAPAALRGGVLSFRGDTVYASQPRGDSTVKFTRAAPRGTVPYINPSPSMMEQVLRRAHVLGGPSVTLPVYVAGGGTNQTVPVTVTFRGDSARLDSEGSILDFRIQPGGAILGGSIPSQGLTVVRVVER
jgi:hypothetical protein